MGSTINALKAETLSGLSSIAPHFPDTAAKILGWDLPGHVPVRWRHARGQSLELANEGQAWVDFDATDSSGRIPANYRKIGIITVHKGIEDMYLQQNKKAEQAVAYLLGDAVMVGTALEGNLFSEHPEDSQRYAVGMGIGRGVLRASMGYRTTEGMFVPLTDNLSHDGIHDPADVRVNIA